MTIEQLLTDLIIALRENTDAHKRGSDIAFTNFGTNMQTVGAGGGGANFVTVAAIGNGVGGTGKYESGTVYEPTAGVKCEIDLQGKGSGSGGAENTLSFDDVRNAIRKLAAADRPAAEALLAKFGVSKISQLEGKPEVWQEAYAEATK